MRGKIGWWVRQAGLILLGGFFLYFGIVVLVGAYALDNPITFIMTFFASNFIILISAALIAGFVIRLVTVIRRAETGTDAEKTESSPADDETRHH
jgi:hypothetical protein